MKHNPANIGRLGWPRRIADPVDRQTVIAISGIVLSAAFLIALTILGPGIR